MAQQITNLDLSQDIGDLKGAVGRIEGLLVGISKDLVTGSEKFSNMDERLRKIEPLADLPARVNAMDGRLQSAEKKIAIYTALASIGGTVIWFVAQYVVGNLFA